MTSSWIGTGARAAVRLALVAVCAGAVAAAVLVPWHAIEREPLSLSAQPVPSASVLACTGPVLAAGRDSQQAGSLSEAARQRVTVGVTAGATVPDERTLDIPDVSSGTGPETFIAPPNGRERTDLAAAGSAQVTDDDLSGFAASTCAPPRLESWLVGGSAAVGAADLIMLSNPGEVAAQVDLTVYGGAGMDAPAAGAGIVVPAGSQRIVPLASLGIGEEAPVVRVTASGAPVHASLQTSIIRTLVPGGVDHVGATSTPTQRQVIPAVTVTRAPGEEGATDVTTLLRVLAPSDDGEATVTVTGVGQTQPADTQQVSLAAGVPLELELGGLAVGTYTVQIDASVPVVGAVWETTGFGAGSDFAWYTSADEVGVPSLVAVASGSSPSLVLHNAGDADVAVELAEDAGTGDVDSVTVPAGQAVQLRVRGGEVYRLTTSGGGVRAAVEYSTGGRLAGYAVVPADAAAAEVRVYPQ